MRTADYMGTPQPTPEITFGNFTMQMLLFINELPKKKNQAWPHLLKSISRAEKYRGGYLWDLLILATDALLGH